MFRKMMIALLVLLQIAVPVGMAAYRPADEDVIREKGTRYTIALSAEGGLSYSSPSRVDAASDWRRITDREQASGRYAVLSTDGNGNVFVSSVSQKKPENGAYLLHSEADRIGSYFSFEVPPETLDILRKRFRQVYAYEDLYDDTIQVYLQYEFEALPDSPTLGVELFVYRGRAALGELLIDGKTAEEFIEENQ